MPPVLTNFKLEDLSTNAAAVTLLFFSLCWALLFCLAYLVARGSELIHCLFLNGTRMLHGFGVLLISLEAISERPYPFIESGEHNNPLHNLTMFFSLSYFIVEFIHSLISEDEPPLMKVHHLFSVVAMSVAIYSQQGGAEMVVGMCLMEFTNPLFQLRGILRLTRLKDGIIYKIVEWTFVVLFVLFRVFLCFPVVLIVVLDPFISFHLKVTFPLFYILSLIMVFYTVKYTIKKYFKKAKSL